MCFICIILLSSLARGQKKLIFSFDFQFLGLKDLSRVQGSEFRDFWQSLKSASVDSSENLFRLPYTVRSFVSASFEKSLRKDVRLVLPTAPPAYPRGSARHATRPESLCFSLSKRARN
jgi:hypothetical protein